MSGWDVQMKSDQMVQQNRLGWGQIEAQASSNSAQMLAQGGQHIGGMIQQQRQFDAQQQMQAAQMQQQAQQFMMDNEIERQSAASDIALRQQQMQESVYKLEAMKALDAAGMSKEQLRSMQLQNDAAEMQMEEMRKKQSTQDEDRVQMMHHNFLKNVGIEGLYSGNLNVIAGQDGRIRFEPFKSPEERDEAIENLRKGKSRVGNPYSRNPDVTRKGLLTEVSDLVKQKEALEYSDLPAEEKKAQMDQIDDQIGALRHLHADLLNDRTGVQQNGGGTPKPQPKLLSEEDQKFAGDFSARVMQHGVKVMASGGEQANVPAERVAKFMAANRAKVREVFNKRNPRYASLSDDAFWSEVSRMVADTQHENHQAIMQLLQAAAQKGDL